MNIIKTFSTIDQSVVAKFDKNCEYRQNEYSDSSLAAVAARFRFKPDWRKSVTYPGERCQGRSL